MKFLGPQKSSEGQQAGGLSQGITWHASSPPTAQQISVLSSEEMLYVLLDHIEPVIDGAMLPLVAFHQELREFYESVDQQVNATLGFDLILAWTSSP
jgi:hypothetical protein